LIAASVFRERYANDAGGGNFPLRPYASAIAETENTPSTYFFKRGVEAPHAGEEFVLVESRKDVTTHDLAPEMRCAEIADKRLNGLASARIYFINFANADMVGTLR